MKTTFILKLFSSIVFLFLLSYNFTDTRTYNRGESNGNRSETIHYCAPKKKIGFLKTHKCASSSIQNILLRYVVKNKLNVVLPNHANYLGYNTRFNRKMIENTVWEQAHLSYDIFLCHTQWDHNEISQVLNDHGDVFYFSVLREPVELFISFWDYYGLSHDFKMPLEAYATSIIPNEIKFRNKTKRSRGYNQMLTDFGMDFQKIMPTEVAVGKEYVATNNVLIKIKEIEKTFDLIILADSKYFDDSIILLKNELCWTYEDVINLKLNSKSLSKKSTISIKAKQNIREWLWADYMLYDYFKDRFMTKLDIFGQQRLEYEKQVLRIVTDKKLKRCNHNLGDIDCQYFRKGELKFLDELRDVQTNKSLKLINSYNNSFSE